MATQTKKTRGIEAKAALWLARHPGMIATPTTVTTALTQFGPVTTGSVAAGVVAAGLGWYRADPDSYCRIAAPRLRSVRRRWTRYHGHLWRKTLDACELTTDDRRTGAVLVPRVLRVSSPTPSIDIVRVKICRGQSLRVFQDRRDELCSALGADVLGIEKTKPRVLTLTLVHGNPFDTTVPAVDIPDETSDVDLGAVELGDTEYGRPWTEPLIGQHWFGCGATGSGKSGFIWNALRSLGPMIRDRQVRVWLIDPKGGMETERARPLFEDRYATSAPTGDDDEDDGADTMLALLERFRDEMKARQEHLRSQGKRKFAVGLDTPLDVLIIDELAMLTALAGRGMTAQMNRVLAEILTQGRACGFTVCAYVQEPTKDVVPVRDLFTRRFCLRTTSASYVDMVLGEDARLRGAMADEIPETEDYAGIGYRTTEKSRNPIRVRLGHVTDEDIDQLVRLCTPDTTDDDTAGVVLRFAATA
ncbi:FtsK/SpoIIIE domain-containing protein [Qaidamihabitans albus]|uniref:FtsK/SpoIIIE domain-containing protein n=1 Tax=Qaidamihabitans albus TaxID=2795733 RepID=UPI0018F24AC6|nr:FtsK/SpoIIIE domain-containing protein [Qaidamihabitans albus]